jgi:CDP-glycerol glycerophosphotransferase
MAPKLSVIVPVYNVDLYLEECLASLAAQTFTDFEVVMVDDGSTDDSAAIAAAFAARDPRFRLVSQENRGLGAARNTGVREASPDSAYLTFVDSDDTLPEDAYRLLVDTLDSTGSDFASGNVLLLRSAGLSPSGMHRKAFATDRLRTHISRDRQLVADRTAWNKVFRRSFWERHAMAFPEGVLFEDAPLTVPAHFRAESVDVLAAPVYHWRQREEGAPSITQNRTDPVGVRDRMKAIDGVSRFLADHPVHRVHKDWYDQSAMSTEITLYLKVLPEACDEFRTHFFGAVADFLTRVSPTALAGVPVQLRLKLYLIGKRRLEELLELEEYEREHPRALPVRGRLRRHYVDYPFLASGPPVPREVLRADKQLTVRAGIDRAEWTGRGLRVSGHAYIRNLDASEHSPGLKALVLKGPGRAPMLFRAANTYRPEATAASGQNLHDYDWSGFEVTIDPERLKRRGEWRTGVWKVGVAVLASGAFRRCRIKGGGSDSSPWLPPLHLADGIRVTLGVDRGHVVLRVDRIRSRVTGHRLDGDDVVLTGAYAGRPPRGAGRAELRLRHHRSGAALLFPISPVGPDGAVPGGGFEARVRSADLDAARRTAEAAPGAVPSYSSCWRADLLLPGGETVPLAMEPATPTAQYPRAAPPPATPDAAGPAVPRAIYVAPDTSGGLTVCDQPVQPVADVVRWTSEGLVRLEGHYPVAHDRPVELVLRHSRQAEEHSFPVSVAEGRFSAEFLPAPDSLAGEVPLRQGRWYAFVRPVGSARAAYPGADPAEEPELVPVRVAASCHGGLPAPGTVRGKPYRLNRRYFDRLLIETLSPLPPSEQGAFHQRHLRSVRYEALRTRPLRDTVLYDTFSGRQFSDSPRAVFEELVRREAPLEHLWVVRDQQVALPPDARAVAVNSGEWYEALATSRFVVANSHQSPWFRRREGQVLVQTWHGTPLKRIAHDIEAVQFADSRYLEKVAEESPNWSFLISPNSFSTPILRRAFRLTGELLESGYPRNDLLRAPDADERAARVRERLGLPEGRKVVLYAPTWRDDQFYGQGRYKFDFRIDLGHAADTLGDNHVLLVRKHPNIVDSVPGAGDGFVFDVSGYPEVAELFLIADVLVTDYSSLMFDFASTGRPMLFFTYDLDHYRDDLRGFYFDFEAQAPGPLLGTSAELVEAIRDVDRVAADYAEPYAAFRRDFCDFDDGKASARVIERMFALAERPCP